MKTAYYNAIVYTGSLPTAQAFVVDGDRFIFAGSNTDALALLQPGDKQQDLAGAFVCRFGRQGFRVHLGYQDGVVLLFGNGCEYWSGSSFFIG